MVNKVVARVVVLVDSKMRHAWRPAHVLGILMQTRVWSKEESRYLNSSTIPIPLVSCMNDPGRLFSQVAYCVHLSRSCLCHTSSKDSSEHERSRWYGERFPVASWPSAWKLGQIIITALVHIETYHNFHSQLRRRDLRVFLCQLLRQRNSFLDFRFVYWFLELATSNCLNITSLLAISGQVKKRLKTHTWFEVQSTNGPRAFGTTRSR